MPTLSALYRYPVKSTAGEALDQATVTAEGLKHDRRFMVVSADGRFITARTHPGLQRVVARFDGEYLSLLHDDYPAITAARRDFAAQPLATHVWADEFTALTTTVALDAWFSRIVGEPVRLLWLGERSERYRASIDTRVSFADGYPLLLTSEASLADVNARTEATHAMAQFRPSIVVAGCDAFAEDDWSRLRIGEVVLRVAEPCGRCVMITVDPARGERRRDGEPMRTLAQYRKRGREIWFGRNLVVETGGALGVGQTVEIVE